MSQSVGMDAAKEKPGSDSASDPGLRRTARTVAGVRAYACVPWLRGGGAGTDPPPVLPLTPAPIPPTGSPSRAARSELPFDD